MNTYTKIANYLLIALISLSSISCEKLTEDVTISTPIEVIINQSLFFSTKDCESIDLELGILVNKSNDPSITTVNIYIEDSLVNSYQANFKHRKAKSPAEELVSLNKESITITQPIFSTFNKEKITIKLEVQKNDTQIIKEIPFYFLDQGEEIEYIDYKEEKIFSVSEIICWDNYSGKLLPPNDEFSIYLSQLRTVETQNGKTIVKIKVSSGKLVSETSKKSYEIPEIDEMEFVFPYEMDIQLGTSIFKSNSRMSMDDLFSTIDIKGENNQSISISSHIKTNNQEVDNHPAYRIYYTRQGVLKREKIQDCQDRELISSEDIALPDKIQLELKNCS